MRNETPTDQIVQSLGQHLVAQSRDRGAQLRVATRMLVQTGQDNRFPFPIEDREGELRGAIERLCELLAQMASPQRRDAVILIAVPVALQAYQ